MNEQGNAPAAEAQPAQAQQPTQVSPDSAQQAQQQPTTAPQQNSEAQEAAAMLESMGSFLSEETKAELQAKAKGQAQPDQGTVQQQQQPAAPEQKPTEKKDDKPAEEKREEPPAFQSKFGFKLDKKQPEKKPDAIVIEHPDHVIDVVNSKFGFQAKSVADLPKFFETAQGWRASAEKLKTTEEKLQAYEKDLASLPPVFFDAFEAISKGEDFMKVFLNQPKIDYNKTFEKQDLKDVVNHYYPGKFTDDDFEDGSEKSDLVKIATEAAEKQFKLEKQQHDSKRAQKVADVQKQQQAFVQSVAGSVQSLKQAFPDIEEETSREISSILEGGPNAVMEMFFDKNGSVKPEAAEFLMLAKYGKQEMQNMMQFAAKRTETQINEDLLTRGADAPKPVQKNTNTSDQGLTEADKAKLKELGRLKEESSRRTF